MVPSAFVPIPALPLTANGKVDRRALPEPAGAAPAPAAGPVAPRTEIERRLAAILKDALGLARDPGIHENFFDLGATSLLLVQMQARVREALGVELPPLALFERTNIAALAQHLSEEGRGGDDGKELQERATTRREAGARRRAARAAAREGRAEEDPR
jgi:acyl carrier protein